MADRTSLGRMIVLVSFAILALVIFSVRLSNRFNTNQSALYKKTISWRNNEQESHLLLHTINFGIASFTAYNTEEDTIIRFSANKQIIDSLELLIKKYNIKTNHCSKCH